jgi:hypothetical protein
MLLLHAAVAGTHILLSCQMTGSLHLVATATLSDLKCGMAMLLVSQMGPLFWWAQAMWIFSDGAKAVGIIHHVSEGSPGPQAFLGMHSPRDN